MQENVVNKIQSFHNETFGNIRAVEIDGEAWFVAADVCRSLDIKNPSQAISRLDEDEKNTLILNEGIGNPEKAIVNEPGLYTLVLGSRKSEAKSFKRWITHDVIPSIRKHGVYMTPEKIEEVLCNPDTIIELATILKEEQEQRKLLEAKIELDRPKVEFAEALEVSPSCISIGDLAKLLHQNGVDIGRNRLFEWLRENGYLMKNIQRGLKNVPTQKAREMKLFEVEPTIHYEYGEPVESSTTVVTTKGQKYFLNLFLRNK